MKRFYKVNDDVFMEFGFNKTTNKWYADFIDMHVHEKITTYYNTDKIKLINDIISNNWFKSNTDNFSVFIEDILKY